jgi:hypothetical protein
MTARHWFVWLHATDAARFQAAYPQAQFVRRDGYEAGIVLYQVTLAVLPSPITFPLVDGAFWSSVHGGYTNAAHPDQPVADIPCHWYASLSAAPSPPPPPDAVTWQPDQWVVTDDGGGPAIFKAPTAGWDEEDDLYTVRVFSAKEAAMDWWHERVAFYRAQEEPPYDEDEDDEWADEEWADQEWNEDADGSGADNAQRQE